MTMKAEFCQPLYAKFSVNGPPAFTRISFLKLLSVNSPIRNFASGRPLSPESRPNCQPSTYGNFQMNGTLCAVKWFSCKSYIRLTSNERWSIFSREACKKFLAATVLFLYTQHSIICYNINIKRGEKVSLTIEYTINLSVSIILKAVNRLTFEIFWPPTSNEKKPP